MKVVTYTSSSGSKINVCPGCERRFHRLSEWPRDARGEEYATVSHGLHLGACDTCEDSQAAAYHANGDLPEEWDATACKWEGITDQSTRC